jgi:hypothetical protein
MVIAVAPDMDILKKSAKRKRIIRRSIYAAIEGYMVQIIVVLSGQR